MCFERKNDECDRRGENGNKVAKNGKEVESANDVQDDNKEVKGANDAQDDNKEVKGANDAQDDENEDKNNNQCHHLQIMFSHKITFYQPTFYSRTWTQNLIQLMHSSSICNCSVITHKYY